VQQDLNEQGYTHNRARSMWTFPFFIVLVLIIVHFNTTAYDVSRDILHQFSRVQYQGRCYPICTEMGLDLEVTSKSRKKKKLDLEQLTRAVVFEISKFAKTKKGCYFPHTLYEILDFNFDISSQHHRSWEFSITTASTVKNMVNGYGKPWKTHRDKIFKLPFVYECRRKPALQTTVKTDTLQSAIKKSEKNHPSQGRYCREKAQKRKCTKYPKEVPGKKKSKDHFVQQARYQSDENRLHFLDGAKINEKTLFRYEDAELPTDPETSQMGAGCGGLLQGNLHIKEEEYDPCYQNIYPDTEQQYYPLHGEVKMESNAAEAEHPGEPPEPLRFTFPKSENENLQYSLAEPPGCAVSPNTVNTTQTEWDTEDVKYSVPVEAAEDLDYIMVTIG